MRGKCNWFNTKRGYGFITPDDKTADVFIHYSGIEKGLLDKLNKKFLKTGQVVEFDLSENEKGRTAINVQITEDIVIAK